MNDRIRPDSRGVTGTLQTAIWTLSPGQMGRRGAQIVETLFSPRRALTNTQHDANKRQRQLEGVKDCLTRIPDSEPVIDLRDSVADRTGMEVQDPAEAGYASSGLPAVDYVGYQ